MRRTSETDSGNTKEVVCAFLKSILALVSLTIPITRGYLMPTVLGSNRGNRRASPDEFDPTRTQFAQLKRRPNGGEVQRT